MNKTGSGQVTKRVKCRRIKKGRILNAGKILHARKSDFIIPEFLERQFMLEIGDLKLSGRIDRD